MPSKLDQNLLPDFDSVKDDDEEILWVGKPEFLPYAITGLGPGFGVAVTVISFIAISKSFERAGDADKINFFPTWIVLFSVVPFLWKTLNKLLSFSNTSYAYSNKRVMMRSGFIGTDFKSIDYDKISDIEVSVNMVERMFEVGTVRFFSGRTAQNDSDTSKLYDQWEAIPNPYEIFKRVKKVSVDIKTDFSYPNALRPETNPGYDTKYKPGA